MSEAHWRFNEESRFIHEDDRGGLALFEVLVATSDRQARTAAAAPTAIDLLRRLVVGYDAAHAKVATDDLAYFEVLAEAAINARPLLAAIDGEPAERGQFNA